ncbi:F-box/FBD/LRR-repeat protein At5g53840-like [Silene latifolia]|uniref:F-box/FBD/LRR-repeat protein At5g53840-like n=1 Tax=Silene latifolia TaxID=37657 RepID=UPI003D776311
MKRNERLNGLPDHLLLEILSLLPLKTAMATAVLSRRWRWLWTHLTDINIDITSYPTYTHPNSLGNLRSLVQNVLPKLTSPFIRNLSFHLRYDGFENHDQDNGEEKYNTDNIVSWYEWASGHKNHLRKLRVLLNPNYWPGTLFSEVPLWIFQTPSLEVLELSVWFVFGYDLVKYRNSSFHLPNLKKVTVNLFCDNPWILEKLVSCSPSLEVLSCSIFLPTTANDNNPIIVNLSSRNLKQLVMELSHPIHIVIDAPKLEYLYLHVNKSSYRTTLSYKISFVDSPTALLTCSISPWTDRQGRDIFLPSNLFSVISGVRSLTTADQNPTPLIAPITFRSLTRLRFLLRRDLNEAEDLEGLALLQQCPILEVLTFDLSEYLQPKNHNWSIPDSTPQCLVTRVKRIEILAHPIVVGLEDMLFPLLKYLLGNAKVLELLKITIIPPPRRDVTGYSSESYNEVQLIKDVFKVPRCSPQSKVEFYSPDRSVLAEEGIDFAPSLLL